MGKISLTKFFWKFALQCESRVLFFHAQLRKILRSCHEILLLKMRKWWFILLLKFYPAKDSDSTANNYKHLNVKTNMNLIYYLCLDFFFKVHTETLNISTATSREKGCSVAFLYHVAITKQPLFTKLKIMCHVFFFLLISVQLPFWKINSCIICFNFFFKYFCFVHNHSIIEQCPFSSLRMKLFWYSLAISSKFDFPVPRFCHFDPIFRFGVTSDCIFVLLY